MAVGRPVAPTVDTSAQASVSKVGVRRRFGYGLARSDSPSVAAGRLPATGPAQSTQLKRLHRANSLGLSFMRGSRSPSVDPPLPPNMAAVSVSRGSTDGYTSGLVALSGPEVGGSGAMANSSCPEAPPQRRPRSRPRTLPSLPSASACVPRLFARGHSRGRVRPSPSRHEEGGDGDSDKQTLMNSSSPPPESDHVATPSPRTLASGSYFAGPSASLGFPLRLEAAAREAGFTSATASLRPASAMASLTEGPPSPPLPALTVSSRPSSAPPSPTPMGDAAKVDAGGAARPAPTPPPRRSTVPAPPLPPRCSPTPSCSSRRSYTTPGSPDPGPASPLVHSGTDATGDALAVEAPGATVAKPATSPAPEQSTSALLCDQCSNEGSWGAESLDASSWQRRTPPLSPLGTAQLHMRSRHPVGLQNLGNTCFLNAALQALAHAPLLASYFLQGHFVRDLNAANPLGSGGVLASAFGAVLQRLFPPGVGDADEGKASVVSTSIGALSPDEFYGDVCRCLPFVGEQRGEQQDAHEVLSFLLDVLHEDLNRTKKRPAYKERLDVQEEDLSRQGDERYAAEAWHDHLQRHRSVLVDLCQGQLRSQVRCCVCGRSSVTFEPFLFLSLPLPAGLKRGGKEPIDAAIRAFCEEETLDGDNSWGCPQCQQRVRARKRLSLWKLPVLLLVHLKRFGFEASSTVDQAPCAWKIEGEVVVPLEKLHLNELIAETSPQRVPLQYDLFATVDHVGSSSSVGHYTAACRRADGWWRFDDSRTEFLGRPEDDVASRVLGEDNYLLLFQRRDAPPEPELMREQSHQKPENWPHVQPAGVEWSFLNKLDDSVAATAST